MNTIDFCQQGFAWADKAYAVDSAHLMANVGVFNRINVSEISYGIIISLSHSGDCWITFDVICRANASVLSASLEKHANEILMHTVFSYISTSGLQVSTGTSISNTAGQRDVSFWRHNCGFKQCVCDRNPEFASNIKVLSPLQMWWWGELCTARIHALRATEWLLSIPACSSISGCHRKSYPRVSLSTLTKYKVRTHYLPKKGR